jgi:hypothetical protein
MKNCEKTQIISVNLIGIQTLIYVMVLTLMPKYVGLSCVTVVVILVTVRQVQGVGGGGGGYNDEEMIMKIERFGTKMTMICI